VELALLRLVLALLVGCGSLLLFDLQPLRHYNYNAFESSAKNRTAQVLHKAGV
jgi:hypothetical protein